MKKKTILLFGKRIWFISLFALSLLLTLKTPSTAAAAVETISGKLADGSPYAIYKPTQWSGTLILDLDGADRTINPKAGAKVKWLTQHGYAFGGTTRNIVGYDFRQAVENLIMVRSILAQHTKMPDRTLIHGISRGSFVARLAMEFEPDIFDGAIVGAGGGSGEIATLNRLLDGLYVLKTLVDPQSPMQIVGVPNTNIEKKAETAALKELVETADATPLGRARLALAAAMEQFAPWTCMNSKEPAPNDYTAQYDQLLCPFIGMPTFIFAHPISVRAPIEEIAGGIVSWNHGVDYSQMLMLSGRKEFVEAMYAEADADLAADLEKLALAPRISADPAAVSIAEKFSSYTGEIKGPIINVDNTGDPIDPTSCEAAYAETIQTAGNQNLLRNTIVHSPGHAGINALEFITGFVKLIDRLDSGTWGATSPAAMNRLARQLSVRSPALFFGQTPRFVEQPLGSPSRTWDGKAWDTYHPPADKE